MAARARIILITGPGKGKTTSAMGVVLRCLACGKSILLVRFTKVLNSGELDILRDLPGLDILSGVYGMPPPKEHPDYPKHAAAAKELFAKTRAAAARYDAVVLDEICGATDKGMIPEEEVVQFLRQLRPDQTVVLTGRGAGLGLIAAADTVSHVQDLKHGFRKGISAQEGVEF